MGSMVSILVNRPEAIEALCVTYNKYYDKHPQSADFAKRIVGDSILFAPSDLKWQQKRKIMSSSLYKEKLRNMVEIIKEVTVRTLKDDWRNKMDEQGNNVIEIVKDSSNLIMKIVLSCLFGVKGGENRYVTQYYDGKKE